MHQASLHFPIFFLNITLPSSPPSSPHSSTLLFFAPDFTHCIILPFVFLLSPLSLYSPNILLPYSFFFLLSSPFIFLSFSLPLYSSLDSPRIFLPFHPLTFYFSYSHSSFIFFLSFSFNLALSVLFSLYPSISSHFLLSPLHFPIIFLMF